MQELLFNPYLDSTGDVLTFAEPVLVGLAALAVTAGIAAACLIAAYAELVLSEIKNEIGIAAKEPVPEPRPKEAVILP